MLYDSLPQRIKENPNFMKLLNVGALGDVKSQNVPRSTDYDRYFKKSKEFTRKIEEEIII